MMPPSFWDKNPIGGAAGSTKKGGDMGSVKKGLTASTPRASITLSLTNSSGSGSNATSGTSATKSRPVSRQSSRPSSRYGTLKRDEVKTSLPTPTPSGVAAESKPATSTSSGTVATLAAALSPPAAAGPHVTERCIDAFLEACRGEGQDAETKLAELRRSVLLHGVPDQPRDNVEQRASSRGKLWKIMLALDRVSCDEYIKLIEKKESPKYAKIRGDSFRTFKGSQQFFKVATESEIIRVLNSFVNRYDPYFTYCQGMNTICGPFLYVMPEVEAFFAFSKLVTKKFPLYWVCSHIGVQAGAILVDQCLKVVDKPLAEHLEKHNLSAYIYAFHCISSLCASIPPFSELVKLWDFLLTFGPHFNIFCVVAQVLMLRERILDSKSPKAVLDPRKWPPLRARTIISVAMSILPMIPHDLFQKVCLHASDPAVAGAVASRSCDNYIPLPADEEETPTEI